MICTQVFPAVRALAHLVRKTLDMPGGNKNSLLGNCRAFNLVVSFLDDVKIPPDIFHTALHHRAQRAIIDEPGDRSVAFGCRPDKSTTSG